MLGELRGPDLLLISIHRAVGLLVFELFPKSGGIQSTPNSCAGAAVPTLWLLQQLPEIISRTLLI